LRVSTAQKRKELEERQQERETRQKLKVKKAVESGQTNEQPEMRRLTQEELLEEAKITEEINMASLGTCKLSFKLKNNLNFI
jgi:vacuolar protein sorting-associated protein 72